MLEKICEIAAELIQFSSTASKPKARSACMSYIEDFFRKSDVPFTIWEPGDVRSMVVNIGKDETPKLCLNGHYDVVEGLASEFRPKVEGDMLYGRGAADMKTSLAAMMLLIRKLAKRKNPPSVSLMIVGDEEMGGEKGTAHILKCGFKCDFAVCGEPTNLCLANQSKGVLGIELIAHGKSAHSARPWEGENPIFSFFQQFPAVWEVFGDIEPGAFKTSMVPTILKAGDAHNRVPDRCICRLDIRYVPMDDPDELVKKIEKAAPGLDVKVVDHGIAFFTEPDNNYLKSFRETASAALNRDPGSMRKHAASDARHFTEQGIPALVFGPGGANIHGRGEWVDLRQVALFYKALEKYTDSL